jgi:hypothetical protein
MLTCSYRFEMDAAAIAYGWHKRRNFLEGSRVQHRQRHARALIDGRATSQSVRLRPSNCASRTEFALATHARTVGNTSGNTFPTSSLLIPGRTRGS